MTTLTLEFQLPESVELSEHDAKMILTGKMVEDGRLSSGQAAKIVGISRREYILTMGKYGFSIFGDMTHEELKRDVENARRASRHLDDVQKTAKKQA